jgi:hypothetical protein
MPRSVWFATAVAIMVLGHSRAAGEGDGWIGRRVFTRYGATLKIGSRVVDDEGRVRSHAASGKDRRTFRVYRVEQIQGPWLWLVSETQGVSGWVKAVDAIPCDQAIAYATAVLYSNPTSAAYVARGIAWHDARQYDRAIVDYNEAIRLNPWNEVAYQNRANALEVQGRFAEALADYDMATRLDPGFDFPYNSRAWMRATCPDPRYRDGRQAVADAMRACQLRSATSRPPCAGKPRRFAYTEEPRRTGAASLRGWNCIRPESPTGAKKKGTSKKGNKKNKEPVRDGKNPRRAIGVSLFE